MFAVTVNHVNHAPTTVDQTVNGAKEVDITLTAEDLDKDPLTFAITKQPDPGSGSVSIISQHNDPPSTASAKYLCADLNVCQDTSFEFSVNDSRGGITPGKVNICFSCIENLVLLLLNNSNS